MSVQIGAKPDAGFDDPIGMLKDCHRRIEQFLRILGVVVERAAGRSLTDEEASAVQASLNYFRTGGRRHTADEEQSLFPRIRKECAADDSCDITRLEEDHNFADEWHAKVDALYSRWIADGALSAQDQKSLSDANHQLAQMYATHIDVEETVVFPFASKTLSRESLAAIGNEFKARRN